MNKFKFITIVVLAVTFLSGCSSSSVSENKPSDTPLKETELFFSITDESENQTFNEETFAEVPFIKDITANSFLLIDGASSSCPNIIENILLDKQNTITIAYKTPNPKVVCTADFRLTATKVTIKDPGYNHKSLSFQIKNKENVKDILIKN
jgi:hypothetical protein